MQGGSDVAVAGSAGIASKRLTCGGTACAWKRYSPARMHFLMHLRVRIREPRCMRPHTRSCAQAPIISCR